MKLKQLLLLAALVMPFSVGAASLVYTGSELTGVTGLQVDWLSDGSITSGTTTFYDIAYVDAYSDSGLSAFNDDGLRSLVVSAAEAIALFLNAESVIDDFLANKHIVNAIDARSVIYIGDWLSLANSSFDEGDQYLVFTEVSGSSVSAVPLPAAVWLFGPALLGFMGFRRKAVDTAAA